MLTDNIPGDISTITSYWLTFTWSIMQPGSRNVINNVHVYVHSLAICLLLN